MPRNLLFQPLLYIYQLFTFKQKIPEFSALFCYIDKSFKINGVLLLTIGEKCNSDDFFNRKGVKTLLQNDMRYKIRHIVKPKQKTP